MSFNDFAHEQKIKKEQHQKKTQQVFSSLSLNDVGIFLGDGLSESNIGIVNLHPFEGTHWVLYINENYFDSYGCTIPRILSRVLIKRNGHRLFSEYKLQSITSKTDFDCAASCLHIYFLTKVLRLDFKSAVLNLYYQIWYNNFDVFFEIHDIKEKNIDKSVKCVS